MGTTWPGPHPIHPSWGHLGTHPGSAQPWMSATHECFCRESTVSRMYSAPFSTWGGRGRESSPQHRAADSRANGSTQPPPRGLTGAGSGEDSGVTAGHHPEPRPGSRGRALAALSAAPPSWAQPWASHPSPLSSGPRAREMQPLRKPHGPGTPEMGWKGITTLKSTKGWLA